MTSQNYRDLIAWQKAMDLVESVYRTTQLFPHEELYGLTSQVRRAAVSIPSNIAEGQGRGGAKELGQFLRIAHGSLCELETQLLIAQRLAYVNALELAPRMDLAAEVGRLIHGRARSQGRR
jgi:four helix bundle protein